MQKTDLYKKQTLIIIVIIILSISISSLISYQSGFHQGENTGYLTGQSFSDSTGFIKAINTKLNDLHKVDSTLKQIDTPFLPKIDYDLALKSISRIRSSKDGEKEMGSFLDTVNIEFIRFLTENLNISKKEETEIIDEYYLTNTEVNKASYEEFIGYSKSKLNKQVIISRGNYENVNDLDKVLSKGFCKLISLITSKIIVVPVGSLLFGMSTKELCASLTARVSKSFTTKLKKMAIIKDYDESKLIIKKQIQSMVVELSSAELIQESTFDHNFVTEIDLWLLAIPSSANAVFKAKSITKAGFRLDKYFELKINHKSRQIEILFPEPEILSHEVNFTAEKLDESWAVNIDKDKINHVMRSDYQSLKNEALKSSLLADSKKNVEKIIKVIFQPISYATPYPYSVILKFKNDEIIIWDFKTHDYSIKNP